MDAKNTPQGVIIASEFTGPTGGAALLPGLNSGSLLISAAVSHAGIASTGRDR